MNQNTEIKQEYVPQVEKPLNIAEVVDEVINKKRKLNESYTDQQVKVRLKKQQQAPPEVYKVNKLNYNEPMPEEVYQLFEKEVKPDRFLISNNYFEWRSSDFVFKLKPIDESQKMKYEESTHSLSDKEMATLRDYNMKRETYPFSFFREFDYQQSYSQIAIKNLFS